MRLSIYDNIGIVAQDIEELLKIIKEIADKFEYTEVIVAANKLEEALDIPSSYETSEFSKMKMLFGNLEGLKHFQEFCDNEGIETKTLFWEE